MHLYHQPLPSLLQSVRYSLLPPFCSVSPFPLAGIVFVLIFRSFELFFSWNIQIGCLLDILSYPQSQQEHDVATSACVLLRCPIILDWKDAFNVNWSKTKDFFSSYKWRPTDAPSNPPSDKQSIWIIVQYIHKQNI